jgi:hypothetical protein
MVTAVGNCAYGSNLQSQSSANAGGGSVASLQGRLRLAQSQLDDWTTCVSSKTTKGQTAIQKLSGEISATKEQIARLLQARPAPLSSPAESVSQTQDARLTSSLASGSRAHSGSVDVWA